MRLSIAVFIGLWIFFGLVMLTADAQNLSAKIEQVVNELPAAVWSFAGMLAIFVHAARMILTGGKVASYLRDRKVIAIYVALGAGLALIPGLVDWGEFPELPLARRLRWGVFAGGLAGAFDSLGMMDALLGKAKKMLVGDNKDKPAT